MKNILKPIGVDGQAMIETALVIPVLLLMFIGAIEFGTRSYNQARSAMAARHGAWLGVHDRYNDIESEVKNFFDSGANVKVEKKKTGLNLDYHNALMDYALFAYTTGYTSHSLEKNVEVSVTYSRAGLPYAPPGPADGIEFLWQRVANYTVTAARGDTATWNQVDFMTMAWLFLASGAWLDILIDIGIGSVIEGVLKKFGKIGEIFGELMEEVIDRIKDIPGLKCD